MVIHPLRFFFHPQNEKDEQTKWKKNNNALFVVHHVYIGYCVSNMKWLCRTNLCRPCRTTPNKMYGGCVNVPLRNHIDDIINRISICCKQMKNAVGCSSLTNIESNCDINKHTAASTKPNQNRTRTKSMKEIQVPQRRKRMSHIRNDVYLEQSTHHKNKSLVVFFHLCQYEPSTCYRFSIDLLAQMGNKSNHNKILWVTKDLSRSLCLCCSSFCACLRAKSKEKNQNKNTFTTRSHLLDERWWAMNKISDIKIRSFWGYWYFRCKNAVS